jgi:oligopeptide transport system substrate-binding protein
MKFAFTAALIFVLSAVAATAQTALERGNGAEPETLDPQHATTAAEANILRDLYEGLVTFDAAGHLVPGVASDWTISDDRLTYTFSIRIDAIWSNGSPVATGDFIQTFQRLFDPETEAPAAPLFDAIRGADAVLAGEADPDTIGVYATDARTLIIELSEPDPAFLNLLALPAAMPLHRNFHIFPRIPAVTQPFNGAYRFDGFEPGVGLYLIKNDRFHDADNVAFDSINYRFYDRQRAIAAFANGELQIDNEVPLFSLSDLADQFGDAFHEAPFAGTFFLAANVGGVLANPNLRRAAALAIDRIGLADDVWHGAMIPTLAILPPGLADDVAPAEAALGPNIPADRQNEARALLAGAGYGADNPLTLTLAVSDGDQQAATAEAIVSDLAEVGIAVNVVTRSAAEHHRHLTGGRDFDLATVAWVGDTGHVAEFLALFEPGDLNVTGYDNPTFASLIAEADITADRTVRSALFFAADRRLMHDLPAIPLMHYASFNLVSPDLTGWEDNALDVHLSRWLAPAEEE